MYIVCRDEILKNVSENLERKLPDPCEVAEGLVYKLTGAEKDTEQESVSAYRYELKNNIAALCKAFQNTEE